MPSALNKAAVEEALFALPGPMLGVLGWNERWCHSLAAPNLTFLSVSITELICNLLLLHSPTINKITFFLSPLPASFLIHTSAT